MEAYPEDYVAHNLPLLALAGLPEPSHANSISAKELSQRGTGVRLTSELPPLSGPAASQLLDEFLKADGASQAWSEISLSNRSGLIGFKLTSTGRDFAFPPRKAAPPPIDPSLSGTQNTTSVELHSPLSPLSPSSPLFADGLLTPLWMAKHQHHVPSVYLSFYRIDSDPSRSTLQDNQLKSEINATKTTIAKSGFKTRYAVVLVGDNTMLAAPEFEDRVAGIRRATGLDPKNGIFFLPPATSSAELSSFVNHVLVALQPICIDYYRDLTKHARRKKGRGSLPTPTSAPTRGSSQVLTMHDWNVRYDFKLAVFAEFRQEMDVAQRHYEAALEEIFGPEGNLETTPSWSPRWEEARLLCDIIAFRVLRCQLWRGMTTGTAESWANYRERMRDLVDRRGKGTECYSWEAWEARWAKMMAQLIEMADLPVFKPVDYSSVAHAEEEPTVVYAPAEKAYSAMDRLPPFQFLHHPGYWWRKAGKYVHKRRIRAEAIPSEDRTHPKETSAAQLASRTRTYDTYLVPLPHEEAPLSGHGTYDYLADIQSQAERAESEFSRRNQERAAQQVRLYLARELVRVHKSGEALDMVRQVWDSMHWRQEGWYDLAAEALRVVYDAAAQVRDRSLMVEAAWELACESFKSSKPINIMESLHAEANPDRTVSLSLDSQSRLSPISLTFSFMSSEGFVGDVVACQIAVSFNTSRDAHPVTLTELRVQLSSNFRSLQIKHVDSDDARLSTMMDMREEPDPSHPMAKSLLCEADLTFRPRQTRVFNVAVPLRDADAFSATGASLILRSGRSTLEYMFSQPADIQSQYWWFAADSKLVSKRIARNTPNVINVLPKPPKMQVRLANLKDQYFTGEKIIMDIEVTNEEDEAASVALVARSSAEDDGGAPLMFVWRRINGELADGAGNERLELGSMSPSATSTLRLAFTAPAEASNYALGVDVVYYLASDSETPISKTLNIKITFVSAFEANYDLGPRLHEKDYPSFFDLPENGFETSRTPEGIEQRWCLKSRIASFSSDPLIIDHSTIVVNKISSNAICTLEPSDQTTDESSPIKLASHGATTVTSFLTTQKLSLEDRRPSGLDLALSITWRRPDMPSTQSTTTLLAIPILTLPAAEPRVLCTVTPRSRKGDSDVSPDADSVLALTYTIENPSMHFLTFTLTMDASDAFAFSGPKFRSLSLTPLSRVAVTYNLLVYSSSTSSSEPGEDAAGLVDAQGRRGRWIWPSLRVVDAYFQKTLKVLDAGPGVKSDGRGGTGVWVAEL
ncbi:hypothetical protein MBLNU459_g1375t1 [Dothideomycetes sp. NU459]